LRTIAILLSLVLWVGGCATYTFQKGKAPYHAGYVVARDTIVVPEYTVGMNTTTPDLATARERFNRRRATVEYYYKQLGLMENRFKENFYDKGVLVMKLFTGIFRLPAKAVSEYRYHHNPQYRQKVRTHQEELDALESSRLKQIKDELNAYIQADLVKYHE
jgi:hypothetical protein